MGYERPRMNSSLWPKIPSSSRKIPLSIAGICSYIETTSDAELAPIMELIVRKEEGGVRHEFVLIQVAKPTGEDFWVRLERVPKGPLHRLVSSLSKANDTATLSGQIDSLLDGIKSVEKTKVIFHRHPSLRDLYYILEALRKESKSYSLWPQNCYSFASVVAEHLCSLDGTAELSGTLRWLDLGLPIRRRFHKSIVAMDTSTHKRQLALQCLDILNNRLSEGVETLLKPTEKVNAVSKDTILCTIPQEVQYACRFWAVHAACSSTDNVDEKLMERLDLFSSTMLLRWVVSMCILDAIPIAITAARSMQRWLDDSGPWSYLKERFYDTERMLLANSHIISLHPAQLYYSVLPFLPSDTYLARQYPAPRDCISVLAGRGDSWPSSLFTLPKGDVAAFAPGGHMLAVGRTDGIHIFYASNRLLNSSIRTTGSTRDTPRLATFTEDGFGIIVVSSNWEDSTCRIEKFDLVKRNGQICRTILGNNINYLLKLSEYGSYIAFPEHKNKDTRISIWKTDGSDDISIPLHPGKVHDLDLTGESAHLIAVAAKDITILSIPSGGVQRTLYHQAWHVHISRDGLFLASIGDTSVSLWSITRGMLLATFKHVAWNPMVFSRTNRLYAVQSNGGSKELKVYNASANPKAVIKSLTLPFHTESIFPTPDESRILVCTTKDIRVLSLGQFTIDTPRNDIILGIDFSSDASLLALATRTEIEIWDARIGQPHTVIQSRSTNFPSRPVAFSPKGELIVYEGDGQIIVMDVWAGALLPTAYSFPRRDTTNIHHVGISYDSSKLAAAGHYVCVWDLPSGTLLHATECYESIYEMQWSRTDQYLFFKGNYYGHLRYLNTETFQEEALEHSGDRFQGPNHLYHTPNENALRIRLSSMREGPLFSALPSTFDVKHFSSRGDRACIISWDRRLLLLDTSGLEAYMEICDLKFEHERLT